MHFDDNIWIDLVRGTLDAESTNEVRQHLAQCPDCSQKLATWNLMAQVAQNDRKYLPPESAVRQVKNEFSIAHPAKESKASVLATLLFDTFAQPAQAGVRSSALASRQLVFKANDITIDLRVDFDMTLKRALLVGQMLHGNEAFEAPVPVLLFNQSGAVIAETETSEFGEFQFEFEMADGARISFELSANDRIQIPLDDLQRLPK